MPHTHFRRVLLSVLSALALLSACLPAVSVSNTPRIEPGLTGPAPATATAAPALPTGTPAPATPLPPEATPEPTSIWLAETLPLALRTALELPEDVIIAAQPDDVPRLDVLNEPPASDQPATAWVYALAAPFATVSDGVALADLRAFWSGKLAGEMPSDTLLVSPSTLAVFEQRWGKAGSNVRVMADNQLLPTAWAQNGTWAIIPFEALEPAWKVMLVDDQSPVRKEFRAAQYGLTVYFGWQGGEPKASFPLPASNRQADRMTTVILTGVTALVRGTASLMERLGMTYPATDTGAWLREADILHINNEVPFARNCPQPYDWVGLVFCSQEEYIKLLEDVGADVIELTGDHFQDWGPEAMLFTLDLYRDRGWQTYGGGANKQAAQQPAKFDHNGNRIAFLGCNAKPPGYATASETTPGALHCDMDDMARRVSALAADGYLPIFTFQHLEYYQYIAHPLLQADFQKIADAGAVIVSGSQAHQPHAFELRDGSFLHYGLGNLFFDQTNQGDPPRTAFIDRHVIYAGKHISTELLTIYFVDYARARPMTPEERATLLETVFDASGW